MLGKGEIDVRVLEDGTVRVETGDMGGVTHQQADNFLKELARLLGGPVDVSKVKQGHVHVHEEEHTHDHEHN